MQRIYNNEELHLLMSQCEDFSLERAGVVVKRHLEGIFYSKEEPRMFLFLDTKRASIQKGDWIIHTASEKRYIVSEIKRIADRVKFVHYQTELEFEKLHQTKEIKFSPTVVKQAISVDAIDCVNCDIESNINELKYIVASKNPKEQEVFNQLLTRLKDLMDR